MGRYYWDKKNTVEDYPKTLNIFDFKRFKMLNKSDYPRQSTWSWSRNGEPCGNIGLGITLGDMTGNVNVHFTQTKDSGEKKQFDYNIRLVSTPCHIGGGRRWWFICPCGGNRCAKLYLQGNGIFASRKTLNLSYESRNESKKYRFWNYVFGAPEYDLEKLRESIKYPYRNGRPTRKMKRYLKMSYTPYSAEKQYEMERMLLRNGKIDKQWS